MYCRGRPPLISHSVIQRHVSYCGRSVKASFPSGLSIPQTVCSCRFFAKRLSSDAKLPELKKSAPLQYKAALRPSCWQVFFFSDRDVSCSLTIFLFS